jgi:hypothetical protein
MLENTNKQKKESNMRSYPIWVDTYNKSYRGSKSQGVRDYAKNYVNIGTSASNSYPFLTNELEVQDDGNKRTFNFYVDNELMKSATYNKSKKVFENAEGLLEPQLKAKYFEKWKAEEEAKDQEFRNKRYAERLAVNG